MNETVAPAELLIRLELSCLYCGHSCPEIRVHATGRPTFRDVRRAIEEAAVPNPPTWDAHGEPRCPRCRGKLFIEESERRVRPARS